LTARPRQGLVITLLFALATPALAWNAAGHRLVANIAWAQLEPVAREQASLLLRAHPDYERWRQRASKDDVDREVFVEASTWADEIRKDPRFYDADGHEATPPLAGFPDMERHRDWHFVNWPLDARPGKVAIGGMLDRQLVVLAATLDRRQRTHVVASERGYALVWLIHLVGDAHQPLHASLRRDAGLDDEQLIVINPFNPRRPRSTLHAFWDDLPGPAWLRGERLDARTRALIAAHPRLSESGSDEWLAESWQLARDEAYPAGEEIPLTLDSAFYEKSRKIADRRVAAAGHRLAALLNRLFEAPSERR
jgi:hypothetical protein